MRGTDTLGYMEGTRGSGIQEPWVLVLTLPAAHFEQQATAELSINCCHA